MSPKKSSLAIGLTALGLFGYTATRAAYPGDAPSPPGPTAAPASHPTHTVLLKTNGRLLSGSITEAEGRYLVHTRGGPIPVPKNQVEATFESVAAVYQYKLARVPERDPDEHLKLAKWCLGQNLTAEALTELKAVLAVSPRAREAKAMLLNLEQNEARARTPRLDPGLMQTSGEAARPGPARGDSRPSEIDPSALGTALRDLNVSRTPVIFDLPPAVAVKRAELFARDVHPVLQAACARCHNEQHSGAFQLVEVKSRRGASGDVLRANLDATLRLVDADNPARSELLSSALVPHGGRPNPRPIFRGANDPRYQILAAWVNSLMVKRPAADGALPARFTPKDSGPAGGGGFAADRGAGQGALPGVTTTPLLNQAPAPRVDHKVLPPSRAVPGQGMVAESAEPSPEEFPIPPMLGGAPPLPKHGAAKPATVPADPGLPLPAGRPSEAASPDGSPPPPPVTKPKTPVKLDIDLLQKAILNRNSGR